MLVVKLKFTFKGSTNFKMQIPFKYLILDSNRSSVQLSLKGTDSLFAWNRILI